MGSLECIPVKELVEIEIGSENGSISSEAVNLLFHDELHVEHLMSQGE